MRPARPAACAAILVALRLGTAVVYPDAYHHFDGAEVRGRRIVPEARGGLCATLEYDPRAHEDAEKQVRSFLAANLTP